MLSGTRALLAILACATVASGCADVPPSKEAESRLRSTPEGAFKLFRVSIRNRWMGPAYRTLSDADRNAIDELDFVAASEDRRLRRALTLPLHRIRRTAHGAEKAAGDARLEMVSEGGEWRLHIGPFLETQE